MPPSHRFWGYAYICIYMYIYIYQHIYIYKCFLFMWFVYMCINTCEIPFMWVLLLYVCLCAYFYMYLYGHVWFCICPLNVYVYTFTFHLENLGLNHVTHISLPSLWLTQQLQIVGRGSCDPIGPCWRNLTTMLYTIILRGNWNRRICLFMVHAHVQEHVYIYIYIYIFTYIHI